MLWKDARDKVKKIITYSVYDPTSFLKKLIYIQTYTCIYITIREKI